MNTRRILLAGAAMLIGGRTALPEAFEVQRKPPLLIVRDDTGNVVDQIAVPETPNGFAYSRAAHTVG